MSNNFKIIIKQVIILFLVIALTSSNFLLVGSSMFKSLISYALDDENTEQIEITVPGDEIFKLESNYENNIVDYEEEWNIKANKLNSNILTISQNINVFMDSEENEINNIKTYYKSTIIDKEELLDLLDKNGEISIYNNEKLLTENCVFHINKEEFYVKTKDFKEELEDEPIKIYFPASEEDNDNTDEKSVMTVYEHYVEIEYKSDITEIYIVYSNNKIDNDFNCNFKHNKYFSIQPEESDEQEEITEEEQQTYITEVLNSLTTLKTKVKVKCIIDDDNIANSMAELLNNIYGDGEVNDKLIEKEIETTRQITVPYTKAKLELNQTELSTADPNNVSFIITLYTNKQGYNLFSNPNFEITMPNCISNATINSVELLNNIYKDESNIFTYTSKLEDNKLILELIGTQEEYVETNIENVQIVINATIETNKLIPTIKDVFKLSYTNLNENREHEVNVTFVSDAIVMSAITAVSESSSATSYMNDYKTLSVEENETQSVSIKNTLVNNTQMDLEDAKILGLGDFIGEINLPGAIVYYSQNESATIDVDNAQNGWTNQFVEDAKAYLIILNISQKEIINYEYVINLPESIEEDTEYYVLNYVYNNVGDRLSSTRLDIEQNTSLDDELNTQDSNSQIKMEIATTILDETIDDIFEEASLGSKVRYDTIIENTTSKDIEDVKLEIELSDNLDERLDFLYLAIQENWDECLIEYDYDSKGDTIESSTNCTVVQEGRKIIITGVTLKAHTPYALMFRTSVNNCNTETIKTTVKLQQGDKNLKVKSEIKLNKPLIINATITSDKLDEKLKANDEINFTINVTAEGQGYADISIEPVVSNLLKVKNYSISILDTEYHEDNEESAIESDDGIENLTANTRITPRRTVLMQIHAIVQETDEETEIRTFVDVKGETITDVTSNMLINIIEPIELGPIMPDPFIGDNPGDDNPGEKPNEERTYSIKGIAWLDINKNGQRENNETMLSDVTVNLINTKTSKTENTIKTGASGTYIFNNLQKGNYILVFEYDEITYLPTTYKAVNVDENVNSDAILTTENNKNTTKTDILTIDDQDLENIDIGLVLNDIFDLEINKYITKVIVTNNEGTTTYNYDKAELANVSIGRKVFNGSMVTVEYAIDVTNKGDVPAYARTIEDSLPSELKFNSELNTSWYRDDNGKLYCVELSQEEIKPGETKTVKLIVSTVTGEKAITLINNVKIWESFNSKLLTEKNQENNSSQAKLLITVNTGKAVLYTTLAIAFITIICAGIYVINKRILLK